MSVTHVVGYLGKSTPDGREVLDAGLPTRVISTVHDKVHQGEAYFANYSELADTADDIEILITSKNSAIRGHMTIEVESALASTVEVWFTSTMVDASGNRLTNYNRDLALPDTSVVSVCHTPTGTQSGTADVTLYIGSTSAAGKGDVGGSSGGRGELLLPADCNVYVLMTSRANANAMTVSMDWYDAIVT